MKNILKKMDTMFCKYLGLDTFVVRPSIVELKSGQLLISNTEAFKRHSYTQNLDTFCATTLKEISPDNKEKLGIAIGKVIAKNLVISFDNIQIKREKINA